MPETQSSGLMARLAVQETEANKDLFHCWRRATDCSDEGQYLAMNA
jgi:hypothetical protein